MAICPTCGGGHTTAFYAARAVPVHSVLLLETRHEALTYRTGDIELHLCADCGFIFNARFDACAHEYSARYEATQTYSPTFNQFALRLARDLIARHDLHHKSIIEIGCGQGEFLTLLCELGDNRGVGFDPAYRDTGTQSDEPQFIADFYSEIYSAYHADFICCRMTLEHIDQTADFLRQIRRSIAERPDTILFFQVPNAAYVLREIAFWDIYYEHCSYFTPFSLDYLFTHTGYDVFSIHTDYDDQYLMIEAKPARGEIGKSASFDYTRDDILHAVDHFSARCHNRQQAWRKLLQSYADRGERIVLWGGGSKGVSFLTTLGIRDSIEYVVDINPKKQQMHMAGTGQRIVSPDFLKIYRPDLIVVMNPAYCAEIQHMLDQRVIKSRLLPVTAEVEDV